MANEQNILGTEVSHSMLNESTPNANPLFLVSHYEEKLAQSMKILLMFNKELSHVKKKNEENEIENTRLKLRIQQLEKMLAEHVTAFSNEDVCRNGNILSTSSSGIPENSASFVETANNLCSSPINQVANDSTPTIFLSSNSEATNHTDTFQNKESPNPSVRKARKTFTSSKKFQSVVPLSSHENFKEVNLEGDVELNIIKIKSEPGSPNTFDSIESSGQCTNSTTIELPESSTAIVVKKEPIFNEHLVNVRTPMNNNLDNITINSSSSLSRSSSIFPKLPVVANNEDACTSNTDTLTHDSIPVVTEALTVGADVGHQEQSLLIEKNTSYVKKSLENKMESIGNVASSDSCIQPPSASIKEEASIMSGDSTEAAIDRSDSSGNDPGKKAPKKRKRYKKKKNSPSTSEIFRSPQKLVSSECDLLIEKPDKENINTENSRNKHSISENDTNDETANEMEHKENSLNNTCPKRKNKRKTHKERTHPHKTIFNNEQIGYSVETSLKWDIDISQNDIGSETNSSVSNQSEFVKSSTSRRNKRKLEMKNGSIDLTKCSYVEESDSSFQIPRKKAKTRDSETSDDALFSVQKRTFQNETIDRISPEHDVNMEMNNQDSDTESNTSFIHKRKLRSCRKGGIYSNQDSDTKSNQSIIPKRKLRSNKRGRNSNQDSDTESNQSIVPEKNLRNCKKVEININKVSDTIKTRSVISERKLRSHGKGDSSPSNRIMSQSQKSCGICKTIGSSVPRSSRKKMQTFRQDSSNENASHTLKRVQKRIICHGKSSENHNGLSKECTYNLKGTEHLNETKPKNEIASLEKDKMPSPHDRENSTEDQSISAEGIGANSQINDHLNKQVSENSFKNKLELANASAEESKSFKDPLCSNFENAVIPVVCESKSFKDPLCSKFENTVIPVVCESKSFKDPLCSNFENTVIPVVCENRNIEDKLPENTNQALAISENQLSQRNDHAEMEKHTALNPIQIPSSSDEQNSETILIGQEYSAKETLASAEETLDLKQTSTKHLISQNEIKRPEIENSANKKITETSEIHQCKLEEHDNLESTYTSSAQSKEISEKDRHQVEEANLKEQPITPLPEIENNESVRDNNVPINVAISDLEEKAQLPVSNQLAAIQETEHGTDVERHTTATAKDIVNPNSENSEDDFSFDSDDTPDINSDYISPESIYDDSDCDPDWVVNDRHYKKPSVSFTERKIISSDENGDKDNSRRNKVCNDAKKNGNSNSEAKTLKVKFVSKRKKPCIKVENKEESFLENGINTAIKEDLTRKKEVISKWEELFWGNDPGSDSSSKLNVDEDNDKQITKNADSNIHAKTTTEDQSSCLKIKDSVSVVTDASLNEDSLLKNQKSNHSLKITENSAAKKCRSNVQKKNKIRRNGSDFQFDSEQIVDETNHETLELHKNLLKKNNQKTILVEDKIFGSDSSLSEEEITVLKACKNSVDNCPDEVVIIKSNNCSDESNSDFDPDLIDEIMGEEIQLPEHLIINDPKEDLPFDLNLIEEILGEELQLPEHLILKDLQKDLPAEGRSEELQLPEHLIVKDLQKDVSAEGRSEELQLPEHLIVKDHQKDVPAEDRINESNDNTKNTELCKNVTLEEDDPICYKEDIHENNDQNNKSYSDFRPQITVSEKNCKEVQLPEHLIMKEYFQKDIPVEDRINASDDGTKNTELCKNVAFEEVLHENNDQIHKKDSNARPELTVGERICANSQYPEHLDLNYLQKDILIEDRIVGSSDMKNAEPTKNLTIEEDGTSCYEKILHEKNKNENDKSGEHLLMNRSLKNIPVEDKIFRSDDDIKYIEQCKNVTSENDEQICFGIAVQENNLQNDMNLQSDSVVDPKFSVKERQCEDVQLSENLIEDYQQIIQPVEDKVFGTTCSFKNVSTKECEEVQENDPTRQEKYLCKINKSDYHLEFMRNKPNCEESQLPENDSQEFISLESEVSESVASLKNSFTEGCKSVFVANVHSTNNGKICPESNHRADNNSNIGSDRIMNEPYCDKLLLPENDYHKKVSVMDRMWEFTKKNAKLASQKAAVVLRKEPCLSEAQPSSSNIKSGRNVSSEACDILLQEEPAFHSAGPNLLETQPSCSNIQSKGNASPETCHTSSYKEATFYVTEPHLSEAQPSSSNIKSGRNASSEACDILLQEEPAFHRTGPNLLETQPSCSNIQSMGNASPETCHTSSHKEATFYVTEPYLSEAQPSSSNIKAIVNNTFSEMGESVLFKTEKEKFCVKTADEKDEKSSFTAINTSNKAELIIDEAENDELIEDFVESDLVIDLPVEAEMNNIEKKIVFEHETSTSETELKTDEDAISGSCLQNRENVVSDENNTFVKYEKEISTYDDMIVKNDDNCYPYTPQLDTKLGKLNNFRSLNEEKSNTFDRSQICINKNSQVEYLKSSLNLNQSNKILPQINLENHSSLNEYGKLDPNKSSSQSKIYNSADQMLNADENQICSKIQFPISHPNCVSIETFNVSEIDADTSIETSQLSSKMSSNDKSCIVSVDKRSGTVSEISKRVGDPPISLPETSEVDAKKTKRKNLENFQRHQSNSPISLPETSNSCSKKTVRKGSETFQRHKDSQRNFKHKKAGKRKGCNNYWSFNFRKVNPENPIKSILQNMDVREDIRKQLKPHTSAFVASVRFSHCLKTLVNYFNNPNKTPDVAYLIYLVIKYLHHTRENPLRNFSENLEPAFLPQTESCIVMALFEIEQKSEHRFPAMFTTLLNAMHQFILAKTKMHIYGLASLCRVFTEICKRRNNKLKPLLLCCDLLKERHKFAALLSFSVAKVWRELFSISDKEEENALQISIAYGITKSVSSSSIVSMYCSLEVISEYFDTSTNVYHITNAVNVSKNRILEKSKENSLKNSWKLTSPLVIFAAFGTWESAKKHLIDDYIIPNLDYFSRQVANEEAFDLFCNLYVDIFLLFPEHRPDDLLMKYFHARSACKGENFIQDCAAVALIKHCIISKRDVPLFLTAWQEKNQTKPKVKALTNFFQRRLMGDHATSFSKDEIIITSQ